MLEQPQLEQSMKRELQLSNAEYHAKSGINKSKLDEVEKSPAHFEAKFLKDYIKPAPTPALILGSAYHKMQTESSGFYDEFVIAPEVNKRTKVGKEAWAEFEKGAKGKQLITEAQLSQVEAMVGSVLDHPAASKLMGLKGKAEITKTWKDYETGLECKCRPDWYCPKDKILVDLKTTEDASPEGFARSVNKFRYHVQAAWYIRPFENIDTFIFIAVEKSPPYAVVCYNASAEMIAAGDRAATKNLQTIKTCMETKRWPSYADTIQTLDLPRWNND